MEKELKGLIIEIITLIVVLVIAVPICAKASNDYKETKETLLNAFTATIDIKNKGDIKELNIYSNNDEEIQIQLGLMISHFYDEYYIVIDGITYNLNALEYEEDENNRYYILGTYDIKYLKKIDFILKPKYQSYYKENLIYSFYAKGSIENNKI